MFSLLPRCQGLAATEASNSSEDLRFDSLPLKCEPHLADAPIFSGVRCSCRSLSSLILPAIGCVRSF